MTVKEFWSVVEKDYKEYTIIAKKICKYNYEDILHDALLSIAEKIDKYDCDKASIKTYVFRAILYANWNSRNKKDNQNLELKFECEDDYDVYDKIVESEYVNMILKNSKLSTYEYDILYDKIILDKTYDEISLKYNITKENAYNIVSKSREKLKKLWGNDFY